jgi:hypothetical protein
MYVKDFDGNGFVEQVVATYQGGKSWPLALRDDLIRSIPPLKSRYLAYQDYARATVTDVFPPAELKDAIVKSAHVFATSLVRNDGGGAFTLVPLPREAQLAPVFGILAADLDDDARTDLLLGGNFDGFKPDIGRAAASYGLVLRGDPSRCADSERCAPFTPLRAEQSGFSVRGQTRDIQRVRTVAGDLYVVARNNDRPLLFRPTRRPGPAAMTAGAGRVAAPGLPAAGGTSFRRALGSDVETAGGWKEPSRPRSRGASGHPMTASRLTSRGSASASPSCPAGSARSGPRGWGRAGDGR